MDLRSEQLKDTYGNLVTTGTTAGSPTSGGLQNGQGTLLTSVGIGTDNPSARLNVAGALGAVIGGGNSAIRMTNTDTSNYASISAGIVGSTNSGMDFSVDGTRSMVIDGSGKVGIGTESPSTDALHVVASGLSDDDDTIVLGANFSSAVRLGSIGTHHSDVNNGGLKFSSKISGTLTERMRIDSDGNVGIGETNPSVKVHIKDELPIARIQGTGSGEFGLKITDGNATLGGITYSSSTGEQRINGAESYVFQTIYAGGAEAMRIDSSGNVGIGTEAPAYPLSTVGIVSSTTEFRLNNSFSRAAILGVNGNILGGYNVNGSLQHDSTGTLAAYNYESDGSVIFYTSGSAAAGTAAPERMRIDSSGNVGIGVSPIANLHIKDGSSSSDVRIQDSTETTTLYLQAQNGLAVVGTLTNHDLRFDVNDNEKMRIDSSGNVLVGKTAVSLGAVGVEVKPFGEVRCTANGAQTLQLNRLTSDGTIADFRKDGTTVGSIACRGTDMSIGNGVVGLNFWDAGNAIIPEDLSAGTTRDDAIDLGSSAVRFDDIYATNGTIQTSDRNEKQDIEELDDAELRVAQKAKTLLRKFRWKSSVEENENARIHFGIIAQDLEQAFIDEGLDAGRYGMFIKSTWTNEDGEEQTRLGVRYNQLLAFIISAI